MARAGPTDALLAEVVQHLSRPDAYRQDVDDVQVVQTHISVLFFAGRRVYKLKKPVQLDLLDYTDAADRKRYCQEEVRLNRRISPQVYLGVRAVTRERDGRLVVDGEGAAVDWVVEMVRLPEERMLDALLDRGESDGVGRAGLERVAAVLARFHGRALTGPAVNREGLPLVVADKVHENLDHLGGVAAHHSQLVPVAALAFLSREMDRFLHVRRRMMERRVGDWRIRDGHGDLHAGNVCLVDDQVLVYDRIEFDRRLRCGDVASDLAFLAMDMDHRGHPDAARVLIEHYAQLTSDEDLPALVDFYKMHSALVRAKVQLLASEDDALSSEERREVVLEAARYAQLAVAYRLPACLVLVGDPRSSRAPASSADHVASRLRAALLHDDERARPELVERAAALLERAAPVVVEAAGALHEAQRPYFDAAGRLGIPLFAVQLDEDARGDEAPSGVPESRTVHLPAGCGPEEVGIALQERMIAALA